MKKTIIIGGQNKEKGRCKWKYCRTAVHDIAPARVKRQNGLELFFLLRARRNFTPPPLSITTPAPVSSTPS